MNIYLYGKVVLKGSDTIVIENNYTGKEVIVGSSSIDLFEEGKYTRVYTYSMLSKNHHYLVETIFGFKNYEAYDLFSKIIVGTTLDFFKVASLFQNSQNNIKELLLSKDFITMEKHSKLNKAQVRAIYETACYYL